MKNRPNCTTAISTTCTLTSQEVRTSCLGPRVEGLGFELQHLTPIPYHRILGLPHVLDFLGCPGFVPCCPVSRQHQPRDAKFPGFQGAVKMTTRIMITIVIIGVIVQI